MTGLFLAFFLNLGVAGFNLWSFVTYHNATNLACLPINIGCAIWLLALLVRY